MSELIRVDFQNKKILSKERFETYIYDDQMFDLDATTFTIEMIGQDQLFDVDFKDTDYFYVPLDD